MNSVTSLFLAKGNTSISGTTVAVFDLSSFTRLVFVLVTNIRSVIQQLSGLSYLLYMLTLTGKIPV